MTYNELCNFYTEYQLFELEEVLPIKNKVRIKIVKICLLYFCFGLIYCVCENFVWHPDYVHSGNDHFTIVFLSQFRTSLLLMGLQVGGKSMFLKNQIICETVSIHFLT